MLQIAQLSKSYLQPDGQALILDKVDLKIEPAESVALLGDSGSGKSTLLHLIAGLDQADSGWIQFNDINIHNLSESALAELRRHNISLIFQQFHLIDTLKVADNIRFQAELCGLYDAEFEHHIIETLGLADQLKKYPWQISRGQQQRVAIARSLLHKPDLVLADEPTGNLDETASIEVMKLFRKLIDEAGSSLLMVTHSLDMARFMSRRVKLESGKIIDMASDPE